MMNKLKSCCSNSSQKSGTLIKVHGVINTIAFQKARLCAERLYRHLPFKFSAPEIREMFQMEWYEYIPKMKRRAAGKSWSLSRPVAVFINNKFLGSDLDFLHYINEFYVFHLPVDSGYYESLIAESCKQSFEKSQRKYVYFTFSTEASLIGTFIFMLYTDLLPLTCQHFLKLCMEDFHSNDSKQYYVNTRVHRVVKNGWIQCGGTEHFIDNIHLIPDESYCIPHDRRGVLSLVNEGRHSNGPQFVVSLKPNPWMNYHYVAFGQLINGARTLEKIENAPTYYECPTNEIVISQCGEFLCEDEPKMETESNVFLEREAQMDEGENVVFDDFDTYSITPWLDNIVDKIDVRDAASALNTRQCFNELL